jgi:hypothetical protein
MQSTGAVCAQKCFTNSMPSGIFFQNLTWPSTLAVMKKSLFATAWGPREEGRAARKGGVETDDQSRSAIRTPFLAAHHDQPVSSRAPRQTNKIAPTPVVMSPTYRAWGLEGAGVERGRHAPLV